MSPYRLDEAGLTLFLKVSPKAAKTDWGPLLEERIQLKVAAPPLEGKANEACLKFLSKEFKCPKSAIRLLKGEAAREKTFLLTRFDPDSLNAWKTRLQLP